MCTFSTSAQNKNLLTLDLATIFFFHPNLDTNLIQFQKALTQSINFLFANEDDKYLISKLCLQQTQSKTKNLIMFNDQLIQVCIHLIESEFII